MTDRTELRRLAEAATPGPWEHDVDRFSDDEGIVAVVANTNHTGANDMLVKIETGVIEYGDEAWKRALESQERKDAAFIAAASPDVVLALLDENEALRRDRDGADDERDGAFEDIEQLRAANDSLRADVARLEAALRDALAIADSCCAICDGECSHPKESNRG